MLKNMKPFFKTDEVNVGVDLDNVRKIYCSSKWLILEFFNKNEIRKMKGCKDVDIPQTYGY